MKMNIKHTRIVKQYIAQNGGWRHNYIIVPIATQPPNKNITTKQSSENYLYLVNRVGTHEVHVWMNIDNIAHIASSEGIKTGDRCFLFVSRNETTPRNTSSRLVLLAIHKNSNRSILGVAPSIYWNTVENLTEQIWIPYQPPYRISGSMEGTTLKIK